MTAYKETNIIIKKNVEALPIVLQFLKIRHNVDDIIYTIGQRVPETLSLRE